MFINSDFSDLLRIFNTKHVRYLVVGGQAVVQYAEPRFTKDLDLWVATESRNAKAVYEALREFGAPLSGLTPNDFAMEGHFYQMGVPPTRVDILMGVLGVEFPGAWERRLRVDFGGLLVPFISLDDLITVKRAVGRPQDMLDIQNLLLAKGIEPQ